jgi:hypothetical protein
MIRVFQLRDLKATCTPKTMFGKPIHSAKFRLRGKIMNNKRNIRAGIAVLSLFGACAANADERSGKQDREHGDEHANVALLGTVTYQDSITPTTNPYCPLSGMTIGTGTVNLLGKVGAISTACISANQGIYTILSSTITVVGPNGDRLFGTYGGSFQPAGGTTYQLSNGPLTITGGTGIFKHAHGTGSINSTEDLATGQGTTSVTATIFYPH